MAISDQIHIVFLIIFRFFGWFDLLILRREIVRNFVCCSELRSLWIYSELNWVYHVKYLHKFSLIPKKPSDHRQIPQEKKSHSWTVGYDQEEFRIHLQW